MSSLMQAVLTAIITGLVIGIIRGFELKPKDDKEQHYETNNNKQIRNAEEISVLHIQTILYQGQQLEDLRRTQQINELRLMQMQQTIDSLLLKVNNGNNQLIIP